MTEGIPYLGSKISLISKSEIRYEGILYTIDTNESTVALAKVRSFGTEDRPTDRPVAARDEVYDYIIFRGRDIKDIRVCEPPKPQLTLTGGLPNDPAIVQHSVSASSYQSPEYGKQCFGPVGGIPAYYSSATIGVGQNQPFIQQQQQQPPLAGSRSATPTLRKSPTMDQGVQVSGISSTPKEDKKDKKQTTPQPTPKQITVQTVAQRQATMVPQNKQLNRGRPRRGRGMRGGRGGFGKPKEDFDGDFSKRKEPQLKFDNDYDFEQANAEFQEMENKFMKTKISSKELPNIAEPLIVGSLIVCDGVPNGDDKKDDSGNETAAGDGEEEQVIYYDRSKSFFDNISCESLERSKGKFQRTDWRQERKLNAETFGVTNSYNRRGGFRGRGFRGRGGFRGGRSRGGGRGLLGSAPAMINRGYESNRPNFSQNRKPPQNWESKA